MFSDMRFRLRALFRRNALEQELDDELRFHLEQETEKHVRAGMSRDDALRRARISFGGVERIKDEARDVRGISLIDVLRQDLRYAWRGLRSRPGFAAAVVLTIGLGVGVNTAMFSVLDRLLLRPPPYLVAADRVHRPFLASRDGKEERVDWIVGFRRYQDLARWTSAFDRLAVVAVRQQPFGIGEATRELTVAAVSASAFDFFDARPVIGRFFGPDEDLPPAGAPVVVLSHDFWRSQFDGRPEALGARIRIGNLDYTVIGVAPSGFVGFSELQTPAAFVPVTAVAGSQKPSFHENYQWSWLEMFVRRKPEVSVDRASADLTLAFRRSWESERDLVRIADISEARPRAEAMPLHLGRTPAAAAASAEARTLTWVMGVAGIVLLVACANVTNLLLARALGRRREIALRLALGISRARLLQQLLTEGVMLAALGGMVGMLVGYSGGRLLGALVLPAGASGALVRDGRMVAFAIGVTLVVALLTSIAPAVQSLRTDLTSALKMASRQGGHRRSHLRSAMLVLQASLCVILLVGAGLFIRSMWNVRGYGLGYDVKPVVFLEANLRDVALSDVELAALNERLLAAAAAVPGVRSASLVVSVPFWSNEQYGLRVPGVDSVRSLGRFLLQAGSPDYFTTMGTRILRGRGFTPRDRADSERVTVVSEGMASALWPGADPLGKYFRIGSDTVYTRVVGISEDIRGRTLVDDREFWYYVPVAQYPDIPRPALLVRVDGRAEQFVEPLRRDVQRELPGAAYVRAKPLADLVAPTRRAWQLGAVMFGAFGILALILAAIGLYSVLSFDVAQRTHELGVRIALGASSGTVTGMIVRQGMGLALLGVAVGSLAALLAAPWVDPLLFEQRARDPVVFGVVAAVLLLVAVAATFLPALRATRVDPTVALRSD